MTWKGSEEVWTEERQGVGTVRTTRDPGNMNEPEENSWKKFMTIDTPTESKRNLEMSLSGKVTAIETRVTDFDVDGDCEVWLEEPK